MTSKKRRIVVYTDRTRWVQILLRAFQATEHEIHSVDILGKSMAQILSEVEKIQPDFCFSFNFHLGDPSSAERREDVDVFFERNKYPCIIWYADDPKLQGDEFLLKRWQEKPYPQNCIYFIADRAFSDFFKDKDIPFFCLPLGADSQIAAYGELPPDPKWAANLRFTGQPLVVPGDTRTSLDEIQYFYEIAYLKRIYELAKRSPDFSERNFQEASELAAEPAGAFFKSYFSTFSDFTSGLKTYETKLAETLSAPMLATFAQAQNHLIEFYSWSQMTCCLRELRSKGILINGSPFWSHFFPDQEEVPRTFSWDELFKSYRGAKINFCFTKWTIPTATHDRIYEILLAGGFPLTNFRDALPEAFEEDEIAYYRSIEEAKELVDFYLQNESARLKLIEKGRQRVIESHTYNDRVPKLIEQACRFWNF